MPVQTTNGTLWCFAAVATMCMPVGARMPPLASTAWQPTMTLLTRAMMANTAASEITVTEMPAPASSFAIRCPWRLGAPSATTTSNFRSRCATSRRKWKVVFECPIVRITSLAWTCSIAWSATCSLIVSISSTSSLIPELTTCLKLLGTFSASDWWKLEMSPSSTPPREGWRSDVFVRSSSPSSAPPLSAWATIWACSSRMMKSTRRTMLPTTNSEGCAAMSARPTARTFSMRIFGVAAPFVPTITFRSASAVSTATWVVESCRRLSFISRLLTSA
mmetsp:Transcript_10157/g.24843  ORF Transcript_10157/g.24843 Transcript_10157/m.24843 type:complete len:276 (-) Transcript_10157:80-907(-)